MYKPRASLHHVDLNDGEGEQPVLIISIVRAGRERQQVFIPQRHAHQFCSESDTVAGQVMAQKAVEYCDHLYGPGLYTKDEARYVADLVLNNLESLVRMPPKAGKTKQEIENAIDRAGLKLDINGENIIDAS